MHNRTSLSVFAFVLLGLFFTLSGWGGILYLLFYTLPTIGPRWLFFFFVNLAFSGMAMPIAALLHKRFPSSPLVESNVILRQSVWVGVYAGLLVWLQLGHILTSEIALFLLFGFIAMEFLLRLRERTRWKPEG